VTTDWLTQIMVILIKSAKAASKKEMGALSKSFVAVLLFAVVISIVRNGQMLKNYDSFLTTTATTLTETMLMPTTSTMPITATITTTTALATTATITTAALATTRRLPTLEELTSIPATYDCPEGYEEFENIVLPESITHADRKIPKVVHITAKTCCVSQTVKDHIWKWKFPDHSLYLHDDAAVFKLMDYVINDQFGNELVQGFSKSVLCVSSGATLSDLWRYTMLYHYGGIYTDMDNSPGADYDWELIQPDTDSFFVVEGLGIMSQFYMASSKHHPVVLQFLRSACKDLYSTANVMINNPAFLTGPGAVKRGFVQFLKATNSNSTSGGYEPEGIYHGGLGAELESELPWYTTKPMVDDDEYPAAHRFTNRTVTIIGVKTKSQQYILRSGLAGKRKHFNAMNMTNYHDNSRQHVSTNRISCAQHASRMATLTATTNTSLFYYNKSLIADLVPRYEFRPTEGYYYDRNTNESVIPGAW